VLMHALASRAHCRYFQQQGTGGKKMGLTFAYEPFAPTPDGENKVQMEPRG